MGGNAIFATIYESLLPAGFHRVTFGASATLATLFGAAVQNGIKHLAIIPDSTAAATWNQSGAADANSAPVTMPGLVIPINKAVADTLQVYGSGKGLILEIG